MYTYRFRRVSECIFLHHLNHIFLSYSFCFLSVVVAQLEDLNRVSVQEEEISRGNMGYVVVLHFSQGYDLGVTETVTAGDKRCILKKFIQTNC